MFLLQKTAEIYVFLQKPVEIVFLPKPTVFLQKPAEILFNQKPVEIDVLNKNCRNFVLLLIFK